nr:Transposase, Tc1-like protein [Ipomoea batatas]
MEFIPEESSNDVHLSTGCSKDKRSVIFETLLKHSVNGKVKYGSIKDVAKCVLCFYKNCNVGRKGLQLIPKMLLESPLNRRTTIRSMASALSMSKTSLHRRVKEGSLKSHSNAIKPMLTEENRKKTNEMFDGKIGMFPFVYKEPAKRRSKNREAGTLETKPIESVNKRSDKKMVD